MKKMQTAYTYIDQKQITYSDDILTGSQETSNSTSVDKKICVKSREITQSNSSKNEKPGMKDRKKYRTIQLGFSDIEILKPISKTSEKKERDLVYLSCLCACFAGFLISQIMLRSLYE